MNNTAPILKVLHIAKEFLTPAGPLRILDNVSLEVSPGESMAITGPSGSGKTTLLNIIASLEQPTSGSVKVNGAEVTTFDESAAQKYRASQIGLVFQEHRLLPQLTAIENVLIPTLAPGMRANQNRATELLNSLGLTDRANLFAWQLSGGERQRIAIARALINGAKLLLCDEPTGNLDQDNARGVTSMLLEVASAHAAAVLIVTHNPDLAKRCTHQMQLMKNI